MLLSAMFCWSLWTVCVLLYVLASVCVLWMGVDRVVWRRSCFGGVALLCLIFSCFILNLDLELSGCSMSVTLDSASWSAFLLAVMPYVYFLCSLNISSFKCDKLCSNCIACPFNCFCRRSTNWNLGIWLHCICILNLKKWYFWSGIFYTLCAEFPSVFPYWPLLGRVVFFPFFHSCRKMTTSILFLHGIIQVEYFSPFIQ